MIRDDDQLEVFALGIAGLIEEWHATKDEKERQRIASEVIRRNAYVSGWLDCRHAMTVPVPKERAK